MTCVYTVELVSKEQILIYDMYECSRASGPKRWRLLKRGFGFTNINVKVCNAAVFRDSLVERQIWAKRPQTHTQPENIHSNWGLPLLRCVPICALMPIGLLAFILNIIFTSALCPWKSNMCRHVHLPCRTNAEHQDAITVWFGDMAFKPFGGTPL